MKSDEEIFADKEKEIKSLKEAINDLENKCATTSRYLEQAYNKEKEQSELMLQMQMHIESLMSQNNNTNNNNNNKNNSNISEYDDSIAGENSKMLFHLTSSQKSSNQAPDPKQRAKTAPVNNQQGGENQDGQMQQQQQRKHNKRPGVHSSPAVFSLDRVMQSFRARTQLFAEALEENDEVLRVKVDSNSDMRVNETTGVLHNLESDDNEEKFDTLNKLVHSSFVHIVI